jgi:NTP pyrophosphatase (non-canonical NTP hydrolase)
VSEKIFYLPNAYQEDAQEFDRWPSLYAFAEHDFEEVSNIAGHLLHASVGAAGEVGELASLAKKAITGTEPEAVDVLEECGDIIWYATLALSAMGISLQSAMLANIAKLGRRRTHGKDKVAERELLKEYL